MKNIDIETIKKILLTQYNFKKKILQSLLEEDQQSKYIQRNLDKIEEDIKYVELDSFRIFLEIKTEQP